MAPKLVRPAAALPPGGRRLGVRIPARRVGAKAKGKAAAKPKAVPVGILKRPARGVSEEITEEEALGVKDSSEKFSAGEAVVARDLPLEVWQTGLHIAVVKGIYWEEEITVAGRVQGLVTHGDQRVLRLKPEGTQNESLVKWAGANPYALLEVDLCNKDCPLMSKDGLVHCQQVRKVLPGKQDAWMDNLEGDGVAGNAEDEMRRLRARQRDLTRGAGPDEKGAGGEKPKASSSGSSEAQKKKKKKKKTKKEKSKISGTKTLEAVFGGTGLDPEPAQRRRFRRRARRIAKKKGHKGTSSSSGSSTSEDSESTTVAGSHLFGEEVRVKRVWKRSPGSLTLSTLEMMQQAVVTQSGQPWDLDRSSVPPIFTQYWRLALQSRMGGAMGRESQTLCYLQDLLLQGKIAAACDVVPQRLTGLEQIAAGGHFSVAQRQELVPVETSLMTSPTEALEAAKLHREDLKARSSAARPWDRKSDWDKKDDLKGKGKSKEQKGKGKGKGEQQGQNKEERGKK